MIKTINLATDFCKAPAGRYREHGEHTGQVFREDFLIPYLSDENVSELRINLDGLDGVGASFWDEAFGVLIREKYIDKDIVSRKLKLICTDDVSLKPMIESVMKN